MSPNRKTSLVAGIFYLLTFVSIPTLALYDRVRSSNYIMGTGTDTSVFIGIVLEMIVGLSGIGTAVTLYPVLKKQNEGIALGFVASRILEASTIFAGVAFLLAIVTLRQTATGSPVAGHILEALYGRIFLIGQSFIPAVNAALLGSLLYRSRLVPRVLPLLGFSGAILLLVSWTGTLTGYIAPVSTAAGLLALPVALWEFSLGLYLVVKGFKLSPITNL